MIDKKELLHLKEAFFRYTDKYLKRDDEFAESIILKRDHSLRVADEMRDLSDNLRLPPGERYMSEAIGLYHDIGRYEQLKQYGTFADRHSENHAELGLREIERNGFFELVEEKTADLMKKAISYHNRKAIPEEETDGWIIHFAKMIRDADKLDILLLATEYYRNQDGKENKTLQLDLPDKPEVNDTILDCLNNGEICSFEHMHTLADFKLIQAGWVYDLNFRHSFKRVKERRYLNKLKETLPDEADIISVFEKMMSFLKNKLAE